MLSLLSSELDTAEAHVFFCFAGEILQESQCAGPKDMPTGHQY